MHAKTIPIEWRSRLSFCCLYFCLFVVCIFLCDVRDIKQLIRNFSYSVSLDCRLVKCEIH